MTQIPAIFRLIWTWWRGINARTRAIIMLTAATLALAAMCTVNMRHLATARRMLSQEQAYSRQLAKGISHYRDSVRTYRVRLSDGTVRTVAQTQQFTVRTADMKRLFAQQTEDIHRAGIRTKDIRSVASAGAVTTGEVRTVPVYVDSIQQLHATFDDGYLRALTTITRGGTGSMVYQYRDSFTLVRSYATRRFLFFRWRSHKGETCTLIPGNPHTRVAHLTVVSTGQ